MIEKTEQNELASDRLGQRVKRIARRAGRRVLNPVLKMFFSVRDPQTPRWARVAIYGALAYFIFPLDAVPDIIPMVGYTDDFGVLMAALATVAVHIKPEHKERAAHVLEQWFGNEGDLQ
ncbi:MAG: DUF1232 domain-containing protein [Deltaproteobacteria bacterium]|nr:DUF1232 domain-containing protein [Deltaproteobacteria bacterium]